MRLSLILALAVATLIGCTQNPISGRSQLLLYPEQSAIAESAQTYQQMVGQLDKQGKLSHDPAIVARVRHITDRLIDQAVRFRPETSNWAWSVRVIDDPKTVNAWCMPGGKMAVYTGLLERLHLTDDELAQVMGHEISHALLKHGAEKMSMQMVAGGALLAAGISGSDTKERQTRQAVIGAGATLAFLLPNSREAEAEADRVGIELAAKAGYHPHAASTLWQKMIKENGADSRFDWLSTHPAAPKRLDSLAALEGRMQPFYEVAPKSGAVSRNWTSLPPNEPLPAAKKVEPAPGPASVDEDSSAARMEARRRKKKEQ
ncbi:MAG TPA: M48 family metallopeptidase [Rhodocyclaceae bacterium]